LSSLNDEEKRPLPSSKNDKDDESYSNYGDVGQEEVDRRDEDELREGWLDEPYWGARWQRRCRRACDLFMYAML
jgi:hypothetical protein